MQYMISFLEGVITFISPCLLPMLPVYISYFAGGNKDKKKGEVLKNAIGFVIGFTIVFTLMGAFAGTFGAMIKKYADIVNIICGIGVIIFGLMMLGVINISIFKGVNGEVKTDKIGFFSSILFGAIFSVGWTPCVGAFLGSALLLASTQGSMMKGILMLLLYSLGLGVPFIASAVLIDKLENAFDFIKQRYNLINKVCGIFLIITGVLMATGMMGKLLSLMTF